MGFKDTYKPKGSFSSGFSESYRPKKDWAALNLTMKQKHAELIPKMQKITDDLRRATKKVGENTALLNASFLVGSLATELLTADAKENRFNKADAAETANLIDNVFRHVSNHYPTSKK